MALDGNTLDEMEQAMVTRIAMAMTVVVMCAGAALADEGPYPVRLNPGLGLASVDKAAIDARLSAPLWQNMPEDGGLRLYEYDVRYGHKLLDGKAAAIDSVSATNCVELKSLAESGHQALTGLDWQRQSALFRQCTAIEMLRGARPARVSYVRDFVMSAEAVGVLPVMLSDARVFKRGCDEYYADRKGVPWSEFDQIFEVELYNDYYMRVWAVHPGDVFRISGRIGGGVTKLRIFAWGDFNGDGIEDFLIESDSQRITWRPEKGFRYIQRNFASIDNYSGGLFILTRDAPDAVLGVFDAERHLEQRNPDPGPCRRP